MKIEEFSLERIQSLYENVVSLNLSDSGVHPMSIRELLGPAEIDELTELELGYGWTNGEVSLRETIAGLYADRTADNVIVTNGSAEANFLMVMSLLSPGDEIVVFTPNYLQIHGWARAIGVDVKAVAHQPHADWAADIDMLRKTVSARTRLITICNPNNPTGATLSSEATQALVDIAREHDIYLHADEVYKGSEFNSQEPPSVIDLYEKAIATNGLSKAMALPGLRIGWLAGPAKEIYAAWQSKDYTSITTSTVSEYIAERVLQPELRQKVLNRSKRILHENLELLTAWVDANSDFVSLIPPRAGGMAFVRYNRDINSTQLAHTLRTDYGVFILPGDVYGIDGHFRIGIGAPRSHLEPGLQQIGEYFASAGFHDLPVRAMP
jgi:hypothetical protein